MFMGQLKEKVITLETEIKSIKDELKQVDQRWKNNFDGFKDFVRSELSDVPTKDAIKNMITEALDHKFNNKQQFSFQAVQIIITLLGIYVAVKYSH